MNRHQKLKARCDSFKSIDVGKSGNLKPEEIEKLPDDKPRSMKDLWNKRQFIDFLEVFEGMIPAVASQKSKKKKGREKKKFPHDEINATLPFLPELGYSFDRNVHSAIYACYRKLLELCGARDALQQSLARSVNMYVDNILCTEREKMCPGPDIKQLLKFLSKNCEEQTLKVEEELCLEFQKQIDLSDSRFFGHTCVLQRIALNFLKKLYIYPLNSTFPRLPGVYFIYHVGKTQLYEGSQVFPSTRKPVYVGMSTTNIAERLGDHRRKIENASKLKQSTKSQQTEGVKLELTDFVVRFMIVDIKHYAPCIESMLIEYFSPVWNREAMAFSFGTANDDQNLWHQFHISKNPVIIENVLRDLRI